MKLRQIYQALKKNSMRQLLLLLLLFLTGGQAQAQITIAGSVYGGGNEGNVSGNTTVNLRAGDIDKVFGGARMANVGGRAFVNIDGEHASNFMLINYVYGGNDISGTIGNSSTIPSELEQASLNQVNETWNVFLRISHKTGQKTYIGQLFGGGNGDYTYTNDNGTHVITDKRTGAEVARSANDFVRPNVGKTYLELLGGSIVYAYGGGNNATVTDKTVIHLDNPSEVVNEIKVNAQGQLDETNGVDLITKDNRTKDKMGINPSYAYPSSASYQIGSFFGGNNEAEMAIRPIWNLRKGKIRNLYSGGNRGRMTSPEGLLLNINPPAEYLAADPKALEIENVYGGCRMADVCPTVDGKYAPTSGQNIDGYSFPDEFSARLIIQGGYVTNVYGGNDITGKVYGGNAIGIRTTVYGDVYGGGNGSYPYTDNDHLTDDAKLAYEDFYYNVTGYNSSVEALNAYRPNAEQVSMRVWGKSANERTIVHGSIYLGGNCATLKPKSGATNPRVELKIGSHVIADKVYLGNNGENMVKYNDGDVANHIHEGVLKTMRRTDLTTNGSMFSSLDLKNNKADFDAYMQGVALDMLPSVSFDGYESTDPDTYEEYSSYFGSFYCGGNRGSIVKDGLEEINFNHKVIIFDKLVGGCNNANIEGSKYNHAYEGGLTGAPEATTGNKLVLNLSGLKIEPKRWKTNSPMETELVWNTISASTRQQVTPTELVTGTSNSNDLDRRLTGGNIYGGCYTSGCINGNVVINLDETIVERDKVFDKVTEDELGEAILYGHENYHITERRSGVILDEQGMDVLGTALNVFGGGKGKDTEIWGSTTINLNKGYTFQIFGGSEEGVIGKPGGDGEGEYPESITFNNKTYKYDSKYSCTINMNGSRPGVSKQSDHSDVMAEAEFIYGGGFEGPILGNTRINLGNGRIFNSFAGSCNADILGHTETYVGQWTEGEGETKTTITGFPWIRDHIYGGNDLGGSILGEANFHTRIREEVSQYVNGNYGVTAYMEYTQGRVVNILGGCYGDYDYTDPAYQVGVGKRVANKPYLRNTFVNIRPIANVNNVISKVFGAGQGYTGDRDGDQSQDHSYVLIDIPDDVPNFANTEIFGAGAYDGLGMRFTAGQTFVEGFDLNKATAVVDLMRGQVGAAYGGSYLEGITRRTLVNVPAGSTIKIGSIFGGAYGSNDYLVPCDVYEANVNYNSTNAYLIWDPEREDDNGLTIGNKLLKGAIYGGNNNSRRTLYGKVNINVPVKQKHPTYGMTTATVYGAGCGSRTWSEYTEVNLNNGASVWEVYGGGEAGGVMSAESVQAYYRLNPDKVQPAEKWRAAWTLGQGYDVDDISTGYAASLNSSLVRMAEMDDRATKTYKYNTNVIINKGAYVGNYAYGGGLGKEGDQFVGSGDVYGTTYIALLGGTVAKDIYAAGTVGRVYNAFGVENYTASSNVYIAGGMARNVYGGGWEGSVGYHKGTIEEVATSSDPDIPAEAHVVIGIRKDQNMDFTDEALFPDGYGFYKGVPAIQRNVYGGGEGGAVIGSTHVTINNGYIGYEHFDAVPTTHADLPYEQYGSDYYQEKIHDETFSDETHPKGSANYKLEDYGNVHGGGFDDNSNVDHSNITVWGGMIRNSVYGGGEIATIGRGATKEAGAQRTLKDIYEAGSTKVEIYNGHIKHDVYGGGKGFNVQGYGHKANQEKKYTDGYVFGQTAVYVYGGEIGTAEGIADGYGNVFGGGNVGYVYSPGFLVQKTKDEKTANPTGTTGSPNHWYYYGSDDNLTEDCKVVISPRLQIKADGSNITYGEVTYKPYDYVPTAYLNTLPKKNKDATVWPAEWQNLITEEDSNDRGVMIHNAVFAGGNVASNTDQTYANATTVYGNTTATLCDVYHRDFITVGTEHTGGLYGGGNLSMVDGYRELNITNYGTDYFALESQISIEKYRTLSNRERAYFKLRYECKAATTLGTGDAQKSYTAGQIIEEDEYLKLVEVYGDAAKNAFTPYGFCSIYAGRLLNTIQRADLCGVYGSRLVLQGAKDRVADVGDATEYTINRVGELSLNLQHSTISADQKDPKEKLHGNYFGIYSVVNRLGNLTSDVRFKDNNHLYRDKDGAEVDNTTYYSYKENDPTSLNRNIGSSYNQVALASGVFLELTTEKSTADHKDYGYITGVVELDLINVKQDGVGGGFVYAKNQHGEMTYDPNAANVVLSNYNSDACTYKQYSYSSTLKTFQTSGNFIHPTKRIIDDCYPTNNAYDEDTPPYSEAHYWYVKGNVYLYDVKVSAYTGSATAYPKEVKIPLTITAASHGKLQLLNVKPNLYAYKMPGASETADPVVIGSINDASNKPIDKVTVNNEHDSYSLNDVITWWDWNNLTSNEKRYFVKETYVNCIPCTIGGTEYETGAYVMDATAFSSFNQAFTYTNDSGDAVTVNTSSADYSTQKADIFRSSNNISHNTGYALTFDMDTPKVWDDWYSPIEGASTYVADGSGSRKQVKADGYREGPTYTPTTTGVYGQRQYDKGEIITEDTYLNNRTGSGEQAIVDEAYVAKQNVTYTYNATQKTVNKGAAIPYAEYHALDTANDPAKNAFGRAYVCINTVKLDNNNYLFLNDLVAESEKTDLTTTYSSLATDINAALTPAYIITKKGGYGGKEFTTGTNYSAISAWCSLSNTDRQRFSFNHDALDLLSDPNYLGFYDPSNTQTVAQAYKQPYSDQVDVEYQAVFKKEGNHNVQLNGKNLEDGAIISNVDFETKIQNEQRHYTRVKTTNANEVVYIANQNFDADGTPYGKGQLVSLDVYTGNSTKVDRVEIKKAAGTYYYCYEAYGTVKKGDMIEEGDYNNLPNDQKYFIIQGKEPTGVTTLYVSSESDIKDVTKEKIITAIYQYTYYEDADEGGIKLTNELHVVNIHLELESGVPRIGVLNPPATVMPGYTIGLNAPKVDPGLYEPVGNGWEIFTDPDDAENHRNGQPFDNGNTPVYWYQNEKAWVAFYSKNYLGKTYSNPVAIKVANYHDLHDVMEDKDHHLYIDHPGAVRDPKIYINQGSHKDENQLDLMKSLFDLSVGQTVTGHTALETSQVGGCKNLEFILQSDLSPSGSWTPIGSADHCFEGMLHGDGHTISGLNNSLFSHLCGEVYNLGVTGTFSSAGIAENGTGYLENCWVEKKKDGNEAITVTANTKALFGNPTNTENRTVHLVNCYYPEENHYTAQSGATEKPLRAFYNGEVAYNLNDFYLYKRYCDSKTTLTDNTYKYMKDVSGTLTPTDGHYENQSGPFLLQDEKKQYIGSYVESRFIDGDFIYAGGTIPSSNNIRMWSETVDGKQVNHYSPIWPDDYLFFGQTLSYGYVEGRTHQDRPSSINRSNERVVYGDAGNRVYRAPAYYRSSEMSAAHFNSNALFAKTKFEDETVKAYEGMTAIDFTGHNDAGYAYGFSGTKFYPPLLDDDGLSKFQNINLTSNLLVYTGTATTAATATNNVVGAYLPDYAYTETNNTYRTAKEVDLYSHTCRGHWVQLSGGNYVAPNDHFLVDREDFNCPIAYTMSNEENKKKRMWYERMPDNFVTLDAGKSKGWEGISLPFTAEIVTTPDKGEITHFYKTSTTGHEYWLREFTGINGTSGDELLANFTYPDANGDKKTCNNTFLWDYYYSKTSSADRNDDTYQQDYYKTGHDYASYPLYTGGTPYLIGFPGVSYYEFDLSGQFVAKNTKVSIDQLPKQTIIFASPTGVTINESDTEIASGGVTNGGYKFTPNYMSTEVAAGGYLLNSDGDKYLKVNVNAPSTVLPFRPYFEIVPTPPGTRGEGDRAVNSIIFNDDMAQMKLPKTNNQLEVGDNLLVTAGKKKICVESQLHYTTDVRIVTPAGVTLASYSIQSSEFVETQVYNSGVYIVYADNGKYVKKVIVK